MTDGISKVTRGAIELNTAADKARARKPEAGIEPQSATKHASANDEVIFSKAVETAFSRSEFDADRVAQIKSAIAEGSYPLDERRIAESFAAIERMLGGN
ncbi:MAG TPA: flagellar biosynthesis anti-sigma factor FlgM [Porticoccaceae bacterium]|jgi:flagellar biosynthesis anti-sigma factor FlgM|nr:flagellar biosynthesis anti-sigma factor FlgM [Porticoccaceae bacterium]